MNGKVSKENEIASSSAYTSNNLGRFNRPSPIRAIVSVGFLENMGTPTVDVAFFLVELDVVDLEDEFESEA